MGGRKWKSYFASLQTLNNREGTDTTGIYRRTQDNYRMIRSRKLNNSNPRHVNVIVEWLLESCQSCLFQKIPLKSLFNSLFFMNAAVLQTYRQIFKTQQESRGQERSAVTKGATFA